MKEKFKIKNGSLSVKKKNNSKYLGIKKFIDPKSGEEIPFRIIGTTQEFADRNFFKVFTAFSKKIIEDTDIAGKSIRLLFYIMSEKIKHVNQIEFSMTSREVCLKLEISDITYRRWVSTLIKKGIIMRIEPNKYKINPECVCVGKAHRLIDDYYNYKKTGTDSK